MDDVIGKAGVAAGMISFFVCLAAGLWVLKGVGFERGDDALWTGIGLYFVGKAFFVGPMLIVTCLSVSKS